MTTSTQDRSATEAPTTLTRYSTAATHTDGNLDALLAYLREVTNVVDGIPMADVSGDVPFTLGRLIGSLTAVTDYLTGNVAPDVRAVSWPVLAEVVTEARQRCGNERCGEWLLPGSDEFCDNGSCRREAMAVSS